MLYQTGAHRFTYGCRPKALHLGQNLLGDVGVALLVRGLCEAGVAGKVLEELDLSDNRVGLQSAECLSTLMASSTSLAHLSLAWNCLPWR